MDFKKLIPQSLKRLIFKGYAIKVFNDAVERAEEAHRNDPKGRRYYVFGTANGDLKITTADEETRDRKRDTRLLVPNVRKPYVLRKQSFYYTKSDVCKRKYQPQGMQDWESKVHRDMFIEWYFKHH